MHAGEADLVLWLSDAAAPPVPPPSDVSARGDKLFLPLATKIDIPGVRTAPEMLCVSAKTGAGLPELIGRVAALARERIGNLSSPAITRERYRQQLNTCMNALEQFMSLESDAHELRAEDLRVAAHALGRITGRVDVEDVLGEIFGRFCIGK